MEGRERAVPPLQPRDLRALEAAPLGRAWAVEVRLHRRRDGPRAEEASSRVTVGEARVRQIDPPGRVELPALPGVTAGGTLGALAGELGHLTGEPRSEERRVGKECRSRW